MTHQITVAGSDIAFAQEPGETILDAAERAGFALPYSCRKGVCVACKGGIAAGEVQIGRSAVATGPCEDVLYCIARATGPIEIAPKWIVARAAPTRKRFAATVHDIARPAPDVSIVRLRLPIGRRVPFRAGQYVSVDLGDGETRNYSLANAPHDNDMAELHVRHVPGGRFSSGIVPALARGDTLDLELPYGLFGLSDDDRVPAIMLATGTGFAPIKSIVTDLMRRRATRPVHLFWGGRGEADLYQRALAHSWAERLPWFHFTPVLSRATAAWTGATGRVQDVAAAAYPDLRGHEVYACGNPDMVDQARATLRAGNGLAEDNFYADAFVPAGVPVAAP